MICAGAPPFLTDREAFGYRAISIRESPDAVMKGSAPLRVPRHELRSGRRQGCRTLGSVMTASSGPDRTKHVSPFDTIASSATRFGIEIVAWVAGPWAVADAVGSWWPAPLALIVLVGLPALFNTPGDKTTTGIATPGPVRIAIEMLLLVTAVGSALLVWPVWAAVVVMALGVALLFTGMPRYRWLAAGAPSV